jgi:hypothetical protein
VFLEKICECLAGIGFTKKDQPFRHLPCRQFLLMNPILIRQVWCLPILGKQHQQVVNLLDRHQPLLLGALFEKIQLPQYLVDRLADDRV